MNRAGLGGLVAVCIFSLAMAARADQPRDPIHDAEVNGSGQNSGVGSDPIHDAETGSSGGGRKSNQGGSTDRIHDAEVHGSGERKSSKGDDDDEPEIRHFAVEANPLGIIIGHYSAQLEWLPIAHHALIINPHFDYVSVTVNNDASTSFVGFGTELSYRFYTSRKDVAGFFVGPSLLLGTYSASADGASSVSFQSIGGAIDVGGQGVVGPGVVIGGGFGLQYTAITKSFDDLPFAAAALAGGGVRPRFLLSVGYAF